VIRLLISVVIALLANAIGLVVAAWLLDGVSLDGAGFVVAVLVFSGVEVVTQPLVTQIALKHAGALVGSSALVAAFVGIVVTAWLTDGLRIDGVGAWLLTTVVVWAVSLVAALVLPALLLRRVVREARR
jgi:putative membrane protein